MNNNIIEQIKDRLDIVEFIRQYVPSLKRAGKTYKACCPFHQEKTPSFTCSSEKGLFYCFGCQAGGDIFEFLMRIENIPFNEAAEKLAQLAGVEYKPKRDTFSAEEQRRASAHKVLDFAKTFYHKNLLAANGAYARAYVKERNLTKETCVKFELGLAFQDNTQLARAAQKAGYSAADLKEAGLCMQTDYGLRDYFRNRLMFPIINHRGDTVGFGGRILGEGEPKYLNSPETILFTKSHVLYGLNFAGPAIRQAGRAVLLEGYMDVIGTHQAGVNYTVAPLGTSLTEEHARLLKRYTENVILLFDPDAAGIKAALRGSLVLISRGLFVKIATLPDGLDPDEYIAANGKEAFEQILDKAEDVIAFYTRELMKKCAMPLSAQDKTHLVTELAEVITQQPDAIVRREWAKYVAEHIGVDENLVLARLQRPGALKTRQVGTPVVSPVSATNSAEEELLSWLLRAPEQIELCAELTADDFSTPGSFHLFQAVRKAAQTGANEKELVEQVKAEVPSLAQEIIKLAMLQIPPDFQPQRDIKTCVARVKQNGVQKRLKEVQQKMKSLGAGNVPPELIQEYMSLQTKLKK
ncbi:DNA primase [Candidatus Avelusimicrobium luingense]|uniref:DNA primase n=1 Tax=Candidatus Avelusimicrobium luingense TaxID=3416211 RepID=UPI003D130D32